MANSADVLGADRRGRLDVDRDDVARSTLQDEVDLDPVACAVVEQLGACDRPLQPAGEFHRDESLERTVEIAPLPGLVAADPGDEGALPDLASAIDQDDAGVRECGRDQIRDLARHEATHRALGEAGHGLRVPFTVVLPHE